jgi:hypothetical protein
MMHSIRCNYSLDLQYLSTASILGTVDIKCVFKPKHLDGYQRWMNLKLEDRVRCRKLEMS